MKVNDWPTGGTGPASYAMCNVNWKKLRSAKVSSIYDQGPRAFDGDKSETSGDWVYGLDLSGQQLSSSPEGARRERVHGCPIEGPHRWHSLMRGGGRRRGGEGRVACEVWWWEGALQRQLPLMYCTEYQARPGKAKPVGSGWRLDGHDMD